MPGFRYSDHAEADLGLCFCEGGSSQGLENESPLMGSRVDQGQNPRKMFGDSVPPEVDDLLIIQE